jgi:hypothetical protein
LETAISRSAFIKIPCLFLEKGALCFYQNEFPDLYITALFVSQTKTAKTTQKEPRYEKINVALFGSGRFARLSAIRFRNGFQG